MAIRVQCECGRHLIARDEFAGKRAQCRTCGRILKVPEPAEAAETAPAAVGAARAGAPEKEVPLEITEFLDPPAVPIKKKERTISLRQMFEALLDPRSIQWMLSLGGGLTVLGLVIWLVAWGVFANPYVLAATLGIGTLAVLGAGWLVALKTRFKVAGHAVTFLGCVLAPLNLWFWHAQDILTLDRHLWIGGVVCCLLYAATVYVLRHPLFMYAVEAGATLTVGLILAELGWMGSTPQVCMFLMVLGLISIHAERAFSAEGVEFTREQFGMPLFWSGHVQLGLSLVILLGVQLAGWLLDPIQALFGIEWQGNLLTQSSLLAGFLWLAGTYGYLYSDVVVRRVGVYTCLAAFCFLLAVVTLVGTNLPAEGMIAVLALTALAAILLESYVAKANEKLRRAVPPLAMALSILPILIGIGLHLRATSSFAREFELEYQTGWWFVLVMLLTFACNRVAAYLYRRTAPQWSAAYFFLCAAALIVAAAGLLRMRGLVTWAGQAPLLMLIPLGYMVASRLWRGRSPELPLYWVAQTATAVILVHALGASQETIRPLTHPVQGETANLLLGLVFAEAAVFYALGMIFRRRSANVYFATAAACGAVWQWLGYLSVPGAYHTMIYAVLGVGLLQIARRMGVEQVLAYRPTGIGFMTTRGRGLPAFQSGNAILSVALLAAFFQGLARLATQGTEWRAVLALLITAAASATAACVVPKGGWRRLYAAAAIALLGVLFLMLRELIHLSGWQLLEVFCVAVGILAVAAGYVGRFREKTDEENEMITLGLWLGSLLATVPLLIAVIYYRFPHAQLSLVDEIALVTVTVLLLLTGVSWQIKSTTVLGGGMLLLYLVILLSALGWEHRQEEWIVGVFLVAIGVLTFAGGIALSVYREKLLELPDRIAKREGLFRIMTWR